MTTKVSTAWHFLCPIHGSEHHAFCAESFKPENHGRWMKYNVIYLQTEYTPEELDEFIGRVKNSELVAYKYTVKPGV